MVVIKHPKLEKSHSGVKASRAPLMSEAEARRKEKPQELATKNMQALLEETSEQRLRPQLMTLRLTIKQRQEVT